MLKLSVSIRGLSEKDVLLCMRLPMDNGGDDRLPSCLLFRSHIYNSTDLSFDLAAPDLGLGLGQICSKNEGGVIFTIAG